MLHISSALFKPILKNRARPNVSRSLHLTAGQAFLKQEHGSWSKQMGRRMELNTGQSQKETSCRLKKTLQWCGCSHSSKTLTLSIQPDLNDKWNEFMCHVSRHTDHPKHLYATAKFTLLHSAHTPTKMNSPTTKAQFILLRLRSYGDKQGYNLWMPGLSVTYASTHGVTADFFKLSIKPNGECTYVIGRLNNSQRSLFQNSALQSI